MPNEIPSHPWQKLATDLFTWNERSFLVTVDYYSRFFQVDELTTATPVEAIRKLSGHFARHDIPETVVSGNGRRLAAEEFVAFAASWDFRQVAFSPGYPQSKGLAEKTVQTAKNILSRAEAEGSDPRLALLEYRSTPVDNLASPAQLLIGRQPRSILPSAAKHLRPMTVNSTEVITRRQQAQTNTENVPRPHCAPAASTAARRQDPSPAFKGGQVDTGPGHRAKQYSKIIPGTD